jgi:protein-S-isoprenylcysteine O-methyltransferase Ste14
MPTPSQIIFFVVLSLLIISISYSAFKTRTKYGLYRFLGFESIAVLVYLNIPVWFDDPFSLIHIISWLFLFISTGFAVYGIYLLRAVGKAEKRVIEETQNLVETGLYKYIRHPLYCSLIYLGMGIFLKDISVTGSIVMIILMINFYLTVKEEELFNIKQFGIEYEEYMKRTKMFIPFLF